MRFLFSLIVFSLALVGCQQNCDDNDCGPSTAIFSFRVLDAAGNDFFPDLSAAIEDSSILFLGSNTGALSVLKKNITVRFYDTVAVFQTTVDYVHDRYLIQTTVSDTLVETDTLKIFTAIEESDCCGIIVKNYNAQIGENILCEACDGGQIQIINR